MEAVFPGFFISSGQSSFFISHLRLDPRFFLIYLCIFLPRWILAWKPIGDWQHLLWDSAPPFLTPKSFCTCAVLEILTSGVIDAVILFLDSSRAQLLLLTLSLKCLGEAKVQFTPLDNLQLFSSGAHLSYLMASTQTQPGEREKGWEISWEKLSWTFVFWIDWIIFFSIFLTMQHGMWDVSSPTRAPTQAPALEAQSLHHWTARQVLPFLQVWLGSFLPPWPSTSHHGPPPGPLPGDWLAKSRPLFALQLCPQTGGLPFPLNFWLY